MNIETFILAAGKGTRMKSDNLPKVMHNIAGYPMIGWIIELCKTVSSSQNLVVGHMKDSVIEFAKKSYKNISFSTQEFQNGTGGAVKTAFENCSSESTHILIIAGDTPLIKKETLDNLISSFKYNNADLALVSTTLNDPGHYGRIKRRDDGTVLKIVEYIDASDEERAICEINSGIYFISKQLLQSTLSKLDNNNKKGEYYLTDIIEIANNDGKKVIGYVEHDTLSISGINNKKELADADKVMQTKIKEDIMLSGVELISPETIYIEKGAIIEQGSTIYPGAYIKSSASIKTGKVVKPNEIIDR